MTDYSTETEPPIAVVLKARRGPRGGVRPGAGRKPFAVQRVYQALQDRPRTVGEILDVVAAGPDAVREALRRLVQAGLVKALGRECGIGRGRNGMRYGVV